MRLLLMSDIHLDCYLPFSTIENGMNSRLLRQMEALGEIVSIGKELKVEGFVFLGDLFNAQTETLPKVVLQMAEVAVRMLSDQAPMIMILGNHDIYRGASLLSVFKNERVVIIDKDTEVLKHANYNLVCVPWGIPIPKFVPDNSILFAHMEATDVVQENVDARDIYQNLKGTPRKEFSAYTQAFLGHYHKRQSVSPKVHYIGSIMQHNFNDVTDERGVTYLEDKDGQLRQLIFNLPTPKFWYVPIKTQEDVDEFIEKRNPSNYYQLQVFSDTVQVPPLDHTVNVVYLYDEKPEERIQTAGNVDIREYVKAFIKGSNTSIDRDEATRIALEVLG